MYIYIVRESAIFRNPHSSPKGDSQPLLDSWVTNIPSVKMCPQEIASPCIFVKNVMYVVLVYGRCVRLHSVSCKTVCRWVATCSCLMVGTALSKMKPSLQWVPGVKCPASEAVHSPLYTAWLKNELSCTYAFPNSFTACTATANQHL